MEGECSNRFSAYFDTLPETAKKKYVEKLTALGGIQDPYVEASAEIFIEWQDWPNVQHADIYNYLITRTSPYTNQQLKA